MITKTVRYGFGTMNHRQIEAAIAVKEINGWAVRQITALQTNEYVSGSLYVVYEKEA